MALKIEKSLIHEINRSDMQAHPGIASAAKKVWYSRF